MKAKHVCRPIDRRYVPSVKGIDLEQALNYIGMDEAGEKFIYDHYTARRLFYVRGSRTVLESAARSAVRGAKTDLQKAQALARWVATRVKWAGYHMKERGGRLATDRDLSEEGLIRSGYGWCNEQARIFCLLAQILGIPSRIVFAGNKGKSAGYGHCVCEILLESGWMMVDQSFGYCFIMGKIPVRASRVFHDPKARAYFTPIYRDLCRNLMKELDPRAAIDFLMAVAKNPLDGFTCLGFLNYFAR